MYTVTILYQRDGGSAQKECRTMAEVERYLSVMLPGADWLCYEVVDGEGEVVKHQDRRRFYA